MTTYIWAIDTPWAKKGELAMPADFDENIIKVNECSFAPVKTLLSIDWIKPIEEKKPCGYNGANFEKRGDGNGCEKMQEEKKLTAEEILKLISRQITHDSDFEIEPYKLSNFLAEHLK